MARRLGIMYIIWNRQQFSLYAPDRGWRSYTGASPHTDHVHFSFTWDGARKLTSYWTETPVGSIDCIERTASSEATGNYVDSLYEDFLGREPDPGGRAQWTKLLTSGTMSRKQVAYSMATTDEWLTHVLTEMYADTLGREPDAQGLANWRDKLRAGMPVVEVAASFYASEEYFRRAGGSNEAWVRSLYPALLERGADPAGMSTWPALAARDGRVAVAVSFYQSTETLVRRVQTLYASLLDRGADPAGLRSWPPIVRDRGDLELAAFLASSQEYYQRAQIVDPAPED